MKNIYLLLLSLCLWQWAQAQDTTNTWQPSISLDAEPVPTLAISSKGDTAYHNSLSLNAEFSIRHRSGWGVSYSPGLVYQSSKWQWYVQRITFGLEQYDRPKYTLVLDYAHDFFASHSPLPYIPLNNEGYALFKYKKIRLHPLAETDIGWGHDTASQGRTSYDVNIALGVEYAIAWHLHAVDISCTPALLGNMGTNSYFFLSQAAPYISHSKGFIKYLKNPHYAGTKAANAIRHIGNNNFIADTSSTKTISSGLNRMEFNNIAAGAELSLSWLSWTLRGDLQAFLPVGAATDHTLSWYGSLTCEYDF